LRSLGPTLSWKRHSGESRYVAEPAFSAEWQGHADFSSPHNGMC
jgi:hypothetical protein